MSGVSFVTIFKLLFALNALLVDCKLVNFSANMQCSKYRCNFVATSVFVFLEQNSERFNLILIDRQTKASN